MDCAEPIRRNSTPSSHSRRQRAPTLLCSRSRYLGARLPAVVQLRRPRQWRLHSHGSCSCTGISGRGASRRSSGNDRQRRQRAPTVTDSTTPALCRRDLTVRISVRFPPETSVLSPCARHSMQVGPRRVSSTHAPHRPMRPTLVPRVIPTRVNVANAVDPDPRRFMEAHHVQRQRRSGVGTRSFRTTAAVPRGSSLTRR